APAATAPVVTQAGKPASAAPAAGKERAADAAAAAPSAKQATSAVGGMPVREGRDTAGAGGERPRAAPLPAGDAAKGARIGRKCLSCHHTTARRKVGPGLAGVFGRKVGQMPDMKYSPALAHGGWHWDAAHLAAWVCDSRAAVRRFSGDPSAVTKMPSQRICDPARQADLIAWLKTLR
ncbi:MAG: c-type cytochrome, partial [Mariprofundaceae bacterium]